MCVLCISNPYVDWHALDPSATESAQAGTGEGGSSNGTSVSLNQALVDQLDSGSYWYNSNGTVAQTISYGFTTSSAFATGFGEASGWSAFTEAQKTAVRQMMTLWDDLIAPSFVESTGSPNTADIKFSNTTTDIGYAHAYFPGQVNSEAFSYDKISGSVWLNPTHNSGINNLVTPTSGVYGYMAIMHEIGHSLGLDHGGNYNGGSPAYGNTSTGWLYTEDSHQFTIMSYFNASNTGANWSGKYAQTPMVYDIMAIQQIYGADYTTRADDTIYGFNSNAGNSLYDFSQNTSPILTIWDGNGIDTIDLSGWSSASVLTLTAGSYSSVNGMTKNLAIAYDVDIENAIGGSGNDTITGNDLDNVLIGDGGADTINGAGGNDTINGGTGIDILIGGTGDDTIYFDSLDNLALLDGGVGFDTLVQLGILITFDFAGHNFERLLNIIADTGGADWTEQTDYYNFDGLYYECDITYDNGTKTITEYDVYNTETWSEWIVTYDANGNIISEVFVPDNGEPPTNVAPSIASNGAGTNAAVNVSENTTAVTTVTAIDANAGTVLTYSIIGGADAAKFTINATTGTLSFVSAPDFEAPTDAGTNNIYDVVIQASDGALTDTQTIAVTVTDQSEAVTVTLINGTSSNNVLNGSAGVDQINGLGGNDIIEGKGGADILDGGAGIDTVSYASSAAGVTVTLNGATATIGSGGDAQGDSIKNFENIIGSGFNDTLTGNSAANVINGGGGADTMAGGAGNDTYVVDNAGDTIIEAASAGTDLAKASITYSLAGSNLENLTLTGSGNINATGNAAANILTGNAGNNRLDGGAGADTMVGGLGDDTYVVDVTGDKVTEVAGQGTDTIETSLASFSLAALTAVENLTYTGTGNFSGTGNALANTITGGSGNDMLNGGLGADTLIGGAGNDTYVVDNVGDVVDETSGSGTDRVQSSVSFDLSAALGDVENLTLTGSAAINGTGNGLANTITGNSGANIIEGKGGADILDGGAGIDTVSYASSAAGVTVTLNGATATIGSGGDAQGDSIKNFENIIGSGFNDTLTGNSAANVINGGGGADTMAGGAGNDTYVVDNAGDTIIEAASAGTDLAKASITYSLAGSNLENLTLTGSGNINATGNAAANILTGNAGNNRLDGGAGADTMVGGLGDDTYVVDVTGDKVTEVAGQGTDTIETSLASFSLAALTAVENLTYTGTGNFSGTGNALANTITGGSGNDMLNGGLGADTLIGGAGNDTYVVDNVGDVVDETSGSGTDRVQSSVSFDLSAALGDVENLTLTGSAAINGTGNGLANTITGNSGANIIEGKGGADILDGGAGIDTVSYASSAAGVTVTLNGATATIGSGGDAQGDSIKNFENIIGSGFNDTLTGNSAANVINGGGGADTMAGGAGNDTYVVDNAGDTIIEAASAGTDLAKASITYSLAGSNLENLTLTGSGNINATGNAAANILTGNAGNNRLDGGAGADTMVGGLGDDTYVVDVTGDKVTEVAGQGTDTIETSLASFSLAALTAVENLTYTGTGNFSGTGNALANTITGGSGNDTFKGGAGGDTFVFNVAAFGDDKITDYQDNLDKLSFSMSVADSFDDFVITGNGTTSVTVTHGADSIILTSAVAFTLAADDFIFV